MNSMPNKTHGLIAAPFTPMNSGGQLELRAIKAYADWLHREGVVGAFICGTTGEGPSLTVSERLQQAEAWVADAPEDLRVIVHVGHNSLPESKRLAEHAAGIGAGAVACMPPYFFKPSSIGQVITWCAEVASAAPGLPFYYYHIPSMSGVNMVIADFLKAASGRIPNLVGVKFTHEDIEDFRNCLQVEDGRFDMLFGRDEILLTALETGARGAVGSTYNFAAPIYLRLIEAFDNGDFQHARTLQKQAVSLIDACIKGPWNATAAFKWLMGRMAVDCGPTRLPIPSLTTEEVLTLEEQLKDFLDGGIQQICQSIESQ
jgi:N-acetylneuraminate lyase